MDYMFEIAGLPDHQQAEAIKLFQQLQAEFHSHTYEQSKIDQLEYQLEAMLGA